MTYCETVEKSILSDFRETLWLPLLEAVERYKLIENGDKIAVCISGGKDSMLLAKLVQLFHRQGSVDFEPLFLVMDPGYNEANRRQIEKNCALLEIPARIFESNIFDVTASVGSSPCYLCARMRRGHLYAKARELGCGKIALGHHFSDVIETTLIGMFYGSQLQGMMPKIHSTNFEGMELVRPLYCIKEEDIIKWRNFNSLEFIRCACRFTEQLSHEAEENSSSKRLEAKLLIKRLSEDYPDVESSIFDSLHNLDLDSFPAYKAGGREYDFNSLFASKSE